MWIAGSGVCQSNISVFNMAGRSGYGSSGGYDGRQEGQQRNMPTEPPFTAFVGNLPNGITEGDIADKVFQNLNVVKTRLVFDHDTSKFKGFCYVEFDDRESMAKALELDGMIHIDGAIAPIRIDIAEGKRNNRGGNNSGFNRQQRGGGGGQGGGGGSYGRRPGGGGFDNFHNAGFNDRGPRGPGGPSGGYNRDQRSNYGNDHRSNSGRNNYGNFNDSCDSGGNWGRSGGGGGNRSNFGGGRPQRQDGYSSRQNSYSSSVSDTPSIPSDTSDRPKLKLAKRSVNKPVNDLADTMQRSSIFGDAKPRDEKLMEAKNPKPSASQE